MPRPNTALPRSAFARARRAVPRVAAGLLATALLTCITGCDEVAPEAAETLPDVSPTVTVTVTPTEAPTETPTDAPPRSAISSGLWSTAQTCAAITANDARDLSMLLSFMQAQPPDMDHVLAAEAVADDFHELGKGTEGPVGEHLTNLADEVLALVAELWEAGEEWVVADETFDPGPFDAALAGLGEECPTPEAP